MGMSSIVAIAVSRIGTQGCASAYRSTRGWISCVSTPVSSRIATNTCRAATYSATIGLDTSGMS